MILDHVLAVCCAYFFSMHGEESRLPGWAWFLISFGLWIAAVSSWEGGVLEWLVGGNVLVGLASQVALFVGLTLARAAAKPPPARRY